MIKELKYVPVCDKSMNRRKLSKKQNEEWTRLGNSLNRSDAPLDIVQEAAANTQTQIATTDH